jgi:hypothetical protein
VTADELDDEVDGEVDDTGDGEVAGEVAGEVDDEAAGGEVGCVVGAALPAADRLGAAVEVVVRGGCAGARSTPARGAAARIVRDDVRGASDAELRRVLVGAPGTFATSVDAGLEVDVGSGCAWACVKPACATSAEVASAAIVDSTAAVPRNPVTAVRTVTSIGPRRACIIVASCSGRVARRVSRRAQGGRYPLR